MNKNKFALLLAFTFSTINFGCSSEIPINNVKLEEVEKSEVSGFKIKSIIQTNTGYLAKDQTKTYSFPRVSGRTYTILLTPSSGDPDLYSSSNSNITTTTAQARSTNGGIQVDRITFTATSSGTNYILVKGYSNTNYTVSVDESGNPTSSTSNNFNQQILNISNNQNIVVNIPNGGSRRINFSGTINQKVTIQQNKTNSLQDPLIKLINPDNVLVTQDDDGGGNNNSLIKSFTLNKSGTWTIEAGRYNTSPGGDFNVLFSAVNPPPPFQRIDETFKYSIENPTSDPIKVDIKNKTFTIPAKQKKEIGFKYVQESENAAGDVEIILNPTGRYFPVQYSVKLNGDAIGSFNLFNLDFSVEKRATDNSYKANVCVPVEYGVPFLLSYGSDTCVTYDFRNNQPGFSLSDPYARVAFIKIPMSLVKDKTTIGTSLGFTNNTYVAYTNRLNYSAPVHSMIDIGGTLKRKVAFGLEEITSNVEVTLNNKIDGRAYFKTKTDANGNFNFRLGSNTRETYTLWIQNGNSVLKEITFSAY